MQAWRFCLSYSTGVWIVTLELWKLLSEILVNFYSIQFNLHSFRINDFSKGIIQFPGSIFIYSLGIASPLIIHRNNVVIFYDIDAIPVCFDQNQIVYRMICVCLIQIQLESTEFYPVSIFFKGDNGFLTAIQRQRDTLVVIKDSLFDLFGIHIVSFFT